MKTLNWFSIIFLLFCHLASATSVLLTWSANTEPDLSGYRVHWGTTSRRYTHTIEVGKATEWTITDLVVGTRYFFSVTAVDYWGNESNYSQEVSCLLGEEEALPTEFSLEMIAPNPLQQGQIALIRLAQPEPRMIGLHIYNVLGQKVCTVFEGENSAGYHQFAWAGTDDLGRLLPTGVYFCRLSAGQVAHQQLITIVH